MTYMHSKMQLLFTFHVCNKKELEITLHCVLCSLPNPLSMSLKAKQSIYNYKHVPDSIYLHNKENQEELYR